MSDADTTTTLLRPSEVAERLRVSTRTVYRLIESGALPAIQITDQKRTRVRLGDLQHYLDN